MVIAMPTEKEQLEFAIDCLKGVCAACQYLETPENEYPCNMCWETPGYGCWKWKYDNSPDNIPPEDNTESELNIARLESIDDETQPEN